MNSLSLIQKKSLLLIAVLHLVGLAGMAFDSMRHFFIPLSPLIILISLVLNFWVVKNIQFRQLSVFVLIALVGFFIEVIGVATGKIFGPYTYGDTLGFQMFSVPLVIGFNWLALSIYAFQVKIPGIQSVGLKIIISATLMTMFDVILEPSAIKLDYWRWHSTDIPMQNYLSWFLLSLIFQGALHASQWKSAGGIGQWTYAIQLAFFTFLLLLL